MAQAIYEVDHRSLPSLSVSSSTVWRRLRAVLLGPTSYGGRGFLSAIGPSLGANHNQAHREGPENTPHEQSDHDASEEVVAHDVVTMTCAKVVIPFTLDPPESRDGGSGNSECPLASRVPPVTSWMAGLAYSSAIRADRRTGRSITQYVRRCRKG